MSHVVKLGVSAFRRGYKQDAMADFEKPDLLDVLEALGVTDLTLHETGTTPYYNGPCPLHQAQRNHTTFIVWPAIQRCACMSCNPEPMDCLDMWMKMRGVNFKDAKEQICRPLSSEETLMRKLQTQERDMVDLRFFADRLQALFLRLDYSQTLATIISVNRALEAGHRGLAEQILRRAEA